ncbi:type IV secretion system protein [Paraburkholderia franconis]|nr:type IV secretion system protein [Paraburkholderia franconis]
MISLISPLMATCFSIYVLLVLWSYWQGRNDEPINDFLVRMATWAFILVCGMNIQFYSDYVVPFFNGLGEQLASALTGQDNPVSGLDSLLSAYINACAQIYDRSHSFDVIGAVWVISVMIVFATPFMALAVAFVILAKFALGLLLALGPLFISTALFPPVRQFFWNWAGQCLNYSLLISLFAATTAIEINFANSIVPNGTTFPSMSQIVGIDVMGVVFFIIALNLPGLASALASGIGISAMTGRLGALARGAMAMGKVAGGARINRHRRNDF